jgi:hypothetical protein
VLCEELIDNLREELVCDEPRISVVGDDDAADAFCASVGVERVVCNMSECACCLRRPTCLVPLHLAVGLGVFALPPSY